MAKIKEKRWALIAGRPDLVMRHAEIPVRWDDDPDRPAVVIIPVSKIPQFMRALARVHARGTASSAMADLLDEVYGDGETGPVEDLPDRTGYEEV